MSEEIWKEVLRGVFSIVAALIGAVAIVWSAYIKRPNATTRSQDESVRLDKPTRSNETPKPDKPPFRISVPSFHIPCSLFDKSDMRDLHSIAALAIVIILALLLLRPGAMFKRAKIDPEYFDTSFRWKRHTYALSNHVFTWEDAQEYCKKVGGHLVTVTTPEEQEKIEEIVGTAGSLGAYWLGSFQSSDGWQWVTQEKFGQYENWDRGEPNGSGTCMQLYSNGYTWDDTPSNSERKHGFICEWEY